MSVESRQGSPDDVESDVMSFLLVICFLFSYFDGEVAVVQEVAAARRELVM